MYPACRPRGTATRFTARTGHTSAMEYVTASLKQCGLTAGHHSFDLAGRRGINVAGCHAGSDPDGLRPLAVSAHYDTVEGSPGADDNASDVAVLLECARVLANVRLERSLEFVAFDMEEMQPEGAGLLGSSAFAGTARAKRWEGLYNLEMVGYTSGPGSQSHPPGFQFVLPTVYERLRQRDFRGDFIATVAMGPGKDLGRRFSGAAREYVADLEVIPIELDLPILADIFRSDHAPFWASGIPAIMITDTADYRNPNYHKPGDQRETLDY